MTGLLSQARLRPLSKKVPVDSGSPPRPRGG